MANRLRGQEVQIRVLSGSTLESSIDSIKNFNENINLETQEDGFLGEPVNRTDSILNGFGGDFEVHLSSADFDDFRAKVIAKATREQPSLVFNIVRTEFFADGSTLVITYVDVSFGALGKSTGERKAFVSEKLNFICSTRKTQKNNLP